MAHVLGDAFEAVITPLQGESPYGVTAQYGERYEAIQREIQKLTAASSKETTVDWTLVRDLSVELLSRESKDLSVACYLTVALFVIHGFAGARDGLEVVRTYVSDHWEGIFPPIKRLMRRANDLRWLIDRLAPLIDARDVTAADADHLQLSIEHANIVAELAHQHLKELAPGFGELIGALKARADQVQSTPSLATAVNATKPQQPGSADAGEVSKPVVPPAVATALPATASTSPGTAAVVAVQDGASAPQIRAQLETALKLLRDADPLSAAPYRILRILKWENASGPAVAGETRIPGPRPAELIPLETMFQAANWTGLLDRSENMFKAGHIWLLDLQRFSAVSLERLDPKAAQSAAATAIKQATREVLKRNPTLVDCSYAGGLPFASTETREWLTEIAAADESRLRVARSSTESAAVAAFEPGDLERAIELLRSKQLTQGMEVLQRGIKRAADRRTQFRARLDAARSCLDANQASWARPMLEALKREAESLTFEVWEPTWAIELHQLLVICYGRLAKVTKGEEQQNFTVMLQTVQDALCRLDVQAAAAIQEEI